MEFRRQLDEAHTSSPSLFSPKLPSFSARTAPPSVSVRPVDFCGTTSMGSNSPAAAAAGEAVRYRECLRNHAASRGGHVVDGCGEFMPSGGGAIDALKCAACGCHRSFHRKESESESTYNSRVVPLLLPPPHPYAPLQPQQPPPPPPPPHKSHFSPLSTFLPPSPGFAAAHTTGSGGTTTESSSEERNNTALAAAAATQTTPTSSSTKKRFRTKFTAEQKEKMLDYAEKVGWRVQRYDDVATEQLCTEISVSRHVLKVWMHNNKHNMKRQQQQQGEADQQQQQEEVNKQEQEHMSPLETSPQTPQQHPYVRQ